MEKMAESQSFLCRNVEYLKVGIVEHNYYKEEEMMRGKYLFVKIFMLLLSVAIISIGSPVMAQEDLDAFMLEEITVTAQKREENQQKVAIAMDVFSAEELQQSGKNDLTEILSSVSGAVIQKAADGLRISIRGISDYTDVSDGQSSGAPTVAINVDGVTSNRKDTGSGLYDLERVEVLYGPQNTLYATNSPGGIVNVVTANPKLDQYQVSGLLELGNYDLVHAQGMLNMPVSEKIALRTAFSSSVRDGYLSNGGESEDTKSARVKALFQPGDAFSVVATAEINRDGGNGYSGGVVAFIDESDRSDPWEGEEVGSMGSNDQTRKKFNVRLDWDFGLAALTVLPSYSEGDGEKDMIRSAGGVIEESFFSQETEEKGVEVRLASSSDFLFKWVAGYVFYDASDVNFRQSDEYLETGVGEFFDRDVQEEINAVFANVSYPLTDVFRLNAGIRYSSDEYNLIGVQSRASADEEGVYEVTTNVQDMESPNDPDTMFGFEYDYGDNTMIYASYATSYRIQAAYRELCEPEKLTAYTLGAKNRFWGNRLQLNASAYYYDYENYMAKNEYTIWAWDLNGDTIQDSDETADETDAAQQGDGRMYGLDFQSTVIFSNKDKLDLSFSYIKSEWTDLYFDYYYNGEWEYDEAADELVWVEIEDESYDGKEMTMTPSWTINIGYTHTFGLWNGGSLETRIESRIQDDYYLTWNEDDAPYNYQEKCHVENFTATYSHPEGKWTLTGYVRNIFDYAEKLRYQSDRGGYLSISSPMTCGVVLSMKY